MMDRLSAGSEVTEEDVEALAERIDSTVSQRLAEQ